MGAPFECPIPVVKLEYNDEGNEQHWTDPRPCGGSLYMNQQASVDLDWLWAHEHEAETLDSTKLSEYFDACWWEVRCTNGHVLATGQDDSGESVVFTWAQVPVTFPVSTSSEE